MVSPKRSGVGKRRMASLQQAQFITSKTLWYGLLILVSAALVVVGLQVDFLISVGAVLGIVLLVAVVKRPSLGFLFYVAFVYLRPADVIPALAAAKVQFLLLGLLIVLWILDAFVFSKRGFVWHAIDRTLLFWLLAMGLSIFTTIFLSESVDYFSEFFKFLIFWFLASQMIDTERELKRFVYLILACLAFVCLIQIWTYATIGVNASTGLGGYGIHIGPIHLYTDRELKIGAEENVHGVGGYSTGFLGNASELGLAVLVMLPFAFYLLPTAKTRWRKFLLAALFGIFLVSLVVCGARGAFLGLVVVFGVLFWRSSHKLAIGLSCMVALAIVVPLLPAQYLDRIESTADYAEDESANIRLTLWTAGLQMMIDRPLFGVGVGNFSTAYGSLYREAGSADLWWEPHNIFVQAGSENGFVGLTAFILIMIVTFLTNGKTRRMLATLPGDHRFKIAMLYSTDLGLIGYIVSGCFITSTYYPHLYLLALFARILNLQAEQLVKAHAAGEISATAELAPIAAATEGSR